MHYLDRLPPPKDYILHVVSMDIVVDSVWGDAMVPGTRGYWLLAAEAGHVVVAFLAGPPCETWSIARGKAIADRSRHRLPRIVRCAQQLWGLKRLALKELQQVLTCNQLLTFVLLMACHMVSTGGLGPWGCGTPR